MTKDRLPTPALIVDLDLFETNIKAMAGHVAASGKRLRPHAKAHKCVQIARRQIAAGADGICVATVPEAELMVNAGIRRVLLTSPVTDRIKMERIVRLAQRDSGLTVVVDHEGPANWYNQAAEAAGVKLNVLVDVDLGDHRTGIAPHGPALQLAQNVHSCRNLQFMGLQAYSVRASHVVGFESRRDFSRQALDAAFETWEALKTSGLPAVVFSAGSTGTFDIDSHQSEVTELQAGSYIFMDGDYRKIGGLAFEHALRVLATVVSANHSEFVTVDAGFKAFSTDRSFPPEPLDLAGARFAWAGDEFGYLHLQGSSRKLSLGDRVEFIPPHCDPTVNLYDRYYACRGDKVEDIWPIMDRIPQTESVRNA